MYVCGIHTDAGKTYLSAVLVGAFNYEYFKLVQAGAEHDASVIKSFNPSAVIHPNGISLKAATSPHLAARKEQIQLDAMSIKTPEARLIVETAGGLFSPIDERHCMIDYMSAYKRPCVLAARYYLGSINHTILSINALRDRGLEIAALVMIGEQDKASDEFIKSYSDINLVHLGSVTHSNFASVCEDFASKYSFLGNF